LIYPSAEGVWNGRKSTVGSKETSVPAVFFDKSVAPHPLCHALDLKLVATESLQFNTEISISNFQTKIICLLSEPLKYCSYFKS
jgi:hypothetical protein